MMLNRGVDVDATDEVRCVCDQVSLVFKCMWTLYVKVHVTYSPLACIIPALVAISFRPKMCEFVISI